ncbi:MAG: hypothetical protein V5B31_12970 [Candidatus Accumulibacter propinquus]|jgi:hypothetical protein|uniref:hypothetical protein n=1 Tax=Candidatus Accumulibacter propinquus TaxID=2954380 RepID=UPI002FC3D45E
MKTKSDILSNNNHDGPGADASTFDDYLTSGTLFGGVGSHLFLGENWLDQGIPGAEARLSSVSSTLADDGDVTTSLVVSDTTEKSLSMLAEASSSMASITGSMSFRVERAVALWF